MPFDGTNARATERTQRATTEETHICRLWPLPIACSTLLVAAAVPPEGR